MGDRGVGCGRFHWAGAVYDGEGRLLASKEAHSHDAYEETVYGLEGILTWTVNGQKHEVGPGQVLRITRGAVHRFDNVHHTNTTMLAIVTPGILGPGYFRDVAAVIRAAGGPPNPAAIAEVMRRHGLTPGP